MIKISIFKKFIKKNIVLSISILAAIITAFFVKPSKEYFNYVDYKTVFSLFSVLAVICALKDEHFFYAISRHIVERFKNTRMVILTLVYITFIGSMVIANDMALLTFLPLGYFVLSSTGKDEYAAFTFVMQNISANLGGMLTPFGNPPNLYLYTKFNIDTLEFIKIMYKPFLVAISLITICCLFVKKEPLTLKKEKIDLNYKKISIYLILFTICVLMVFRFLNYIYATIFILIVIWIMDKNAIKEVDYPLLFTFVFFFIFSGNMSRIPKVQLFFGRLLAKDTILFSAIPPQFISGVPSTILLSQFTNNYRDLLLGSNVGAVGTLVSSLASLITLRSFTKYYKKDIKKYLILFNIINFAFLAILLCFVKFAM